VGEMILRKPRTVYGPAMTAMRRSFSNLTRASTERWVSDNIGLVPSDEVDKERLGRTGTLRRRLSRRSRVR
jgi:hypothetical protein